MLPPTSSAPVLLLPDVLFLFAEPRRDGGEEAREGAERRAALDVDAVGARDAEGEARANRRALPFGLELLLVVLEHAAEPVQIVRVRVVVDELRLPLRLRERLRVGRARTERAPALSRVNHALDGRAVARGHEGRADERVLQSLPVLARDAAQRDALVLARGHLAL